MRDAISIQREIFEIDSRILELKVRRSQLDVEVLEFNKNNFENQISQNNKQVVTPEVVA